MHPLGARTAFPALAGITILVASACGAPRQSSEAELTVGAVSSALHVNPFSSTGLPFGPKKLFLDTTGAIISATLDSDGRRVSVSSMDVSSGATSNIYVSPPGVTDWSGASFTATASHLYVGWGRHILEIERSTSSARDLLLPDVARGEGPAGIVGMAPDGSSGLLTAVNGVEDLLDVTPATGNWIKQPSGLVGDSGGVLTRSQSGDVIEVGRTLSSTDTTRPVFVIRGSQVASTSSTAANAVVASDNAGLVGALTASSVDLISASVAPKTYSLSSIAGTVLPLAVALNADTLWAVRMGASNGTIRIDKISRQTGDDSSVDFPVVAVHGGRKGLSSQKASTVTSVDPMITSVVVAPDGSAYVATICGVRQESRDCTYASVYHVQ